MRGSDTWLVYSLPEQAPNHHGGGDLRCGGSLTQLGIQFSVDAQVQRHVQGAGLLGDLGVGGFGFFLSDFRADRFVPRATSNASPAGRIRHSAGLLALEVLTEVDSARLPCGNTGPATASSDPGAIAVPSASNGIW